MCILYRGLYVFFCSVSAEGIFTGFAFCFSWRTVDELHPLLNFCFLIKEDPSIQTLNVGRDYDYLVQQDEQSKGMNGIDSWLHEMTHVYDSRRRSFLYAYVGRKKAY